MLISQIEALSYASELAKIASENDFQPDRARVLAALSAEMGGLRDEAAARLGLNQSVAVSDDRQRSVPSGGGPRIDDVPVRWYAALNGSARPAGRSSRARWLRSRRGRWPSTGSPDARPHRPAAVRRRLP